ncbi:uncharacterized protein LOC133516069 [Cydia pomonella]|uniref:uncharacterized protein LOC133516069 n=1 Tax=Cydia pomonella TaxID=82600 RepID=UPI002ADE2EBD|nr:uncharacterized protein LOC133516069 [Cydia pomonella]
MTAHALVYFVIIIIINNVNAGWDADPSIRPKMKRRMGYLGVPTKHRLALRTVEDDMQQNMIYMHSAILQFKSDINHLKSYIPLIQTFEQLLDDCEAIQVQTATTPKNGPTYPTEPPTNNKWFWYDPYKIKHIRHHHKDYNSHHHREHNSHQRHEYREHSK